MSEEQYPPLVIKLVNTSETNWVLEGTEKDPAPQRLSWPGLMRIIPTSKVREDIPSTEGGGFRYKPIRHIAGCDFIDPVRQEKEGFKPNVEHDNIWISMGTTTIVRSGADIGKYDYLKNYEGNVSNPRRPPEAENLFEEIVAVEVARVENVRYDKKADAYAILREIRVPSDDGGFKYNMEKLALVSTLLGLNHLDTPEEKFTELYRIADFKPEIILDSVANSKKKLLAMIRKAEELSVLQFADDRAYFTETNTVLLGYKGRVTRNSQISKLADFLLTEDGKPFMQQMELSVETAGNKSLERVRPAEKQLS